MFGGGAGASTGRSARPRRGARAVRCRPALKEGGSGRFWVVTVGPRISQDGRLCLEEEKDFLLRARSGPRRPRRTRPQPTPEWMESVTPDPALLFRFSAVTYNTHRIHYDASYATGVEGYPDLVVHGPLDRDPPRVNGRTLQRSRVRSLSFRARAPLFVDRRIWLTGAPFGAGVSMTARRSDHTVAMTMDAELERQETATLNRASVGLPAEPSA